MRRTCGSEQLDNGAMAWCCSRSIVDRGTGGGEEARSSLLEREGEGGARGLADALLVGWINGEKWLALVGSG